MADSGLLQSFSFGGTVYDADDCLGEGTLSYSINGIQYQCNGFQKTAIGAKTATFAINIMLAATDTAKIAALESGTTGAFEWHPAGDTTTYIEATSTKATVVSSPISAGSESVIMLSLTFNLDDLTLGAAA